MIQIVATGCLVVLALCLVANLVRLVRGPSAADRVLAADVIFMDLVALVTVYSVALDTPFYFDLILVFSLLGFLASVSFAKFLGRGKIIE